MTSPYELPHLDLSRRFQAVPFTSAARNPVGAGTPRSREHHGAKLRGELAAAYGAFDAARREDERIGPPAGAFLEVELKRGTRIETVERKKNGIVPGAARREETDIRIVGLYVPDGAREVFHDILREYQEGELTPKGKPRRKNFVEAIESIRQARLETFWTDDVSRLPPPGREMWWEIWCLRRLEDALEDLIERLGARAAERERRLYFPEHVVLPVLADRATIELMLFARLSIVELRRASDSPVFFLDELDRDEQREVSENLAERTQWPGADVPAVCLLDTGVNRVQRVFASRHGRRHQPLYADFDAVALPETRRPSRPRVFCLAVTNDDRSGVRPTTWSSAIDQEAAGVTELDEKAPPRLFIVSAGNAPNPIEVDQIADPDSLEIEDPAQAWNAITVGGYTDLVNIHEPHFKGYSPLAMAGDISPYTRTSTLWLQGKSPFKPDIVMEAGNRAVSPSRTDAYDADSLALLSTGPNTDLHPLVSFRATSAATAQAARLAARLMAKFPDYWPETIRALLIHGADWTPRMTSFLKAAPNKAAAYLLLRRYGHGVPTFERAAASARNHLALVAQAEIQPYQRSGKGMNECHFYSLPWPREALESLGEQDVALKITLSYFIEPNPGSSASFDPYRYQSYGLRFDLKRRSETLVEFAKRLNKQAREGPDDRPSSEPDRDNWRFGPNSMSAGSLHSDEWTGPAVNLLSRNVICIKPVGGWWNDRAKAQVRGQKARYSLVVSLRSPDTDVDLYTPISVMMETGIGVETIVVPAGTAD